MVRPKPDEEIDQHHEPDRDGVAARDGERDGCQSYDHDDGVKAAENGGRVGVHDTLVSPRGAGIGCLWAASVGCAVACGFLKNTTGCDKSHPVARLK